jgi:hypothetical protein
MMTRRVRTGLIMVVAVVSAACATKSINQVRADPAKYRNQTITVRGTVAESASIMGKGAYKLTDGEDSLWVVTSGGAPRTGARVDVTGRIEDGYDLGGLGRILKLPEALQNGLVLIESSHKARD